MAIVYALYRIVAYTNVDAEIELLKVKVPLICLGTEGVSLRRRDVTSKLQSTVIKFSGQVAKLLGDVIANFSATLQSGCPETRNEWKSITTRRARTRGGGCPGWAAQHRKDVPRRAKPRSDWLLKLPDPCPETRNEVEGNTTRREDGGYVWVGS